MLTTTTPSRRLDHPRVEWSAYGGADPKSFEIRTADVLAQRHVGLSACNDVQTARGVIGKEAGHDRSGGLLHPLERG
jgi:hypothetical protein